MFSPIYREFKIDFEERQSLIRERITTVLSESESRLRDKPRVKVVTRPSIIISYKRISVCVLLITAFYVFTQGRDKSVEHTFPTQCIQQI